MPKLHDTWTVLPHGPLRELSPGLLTVVGQIPMPLGNFPRRMTVVSLPRKRTAIWSPMALGEAEMAAIEALGAPAFLIIPNRAHRLDARAFVARYPKARVITAPAAEKMVEEAVPVAATMADLSPAADLVVLAGCDSQELAMIVHRDGGDTLVVNDIIGNVAHPVGIGAWIMSRLTGFGPTPRIPRVARRMFVTNPVALAAQFRAWAANPRLRRIIPSHGDIIDDAPGALLARLAQELAPSN